ncbi:MAG: ABC transporter substrate-binding protein [Gammaproteobacteria bacterium]
MTDVTLDAAFGDYDRTAPLRTGDVRVQGIDLRVQALPPTEIFRRMCESQAFDVSEMSMGAHIYLTGTGNNPFVAMPAFPSRAFRHSMVYANVDSGIDRPQDLNGKTIATREWGMTALIWIVGILVEEYGLDLRSIDWVCAIEPRVPLSMPEGVNCRLMAPDETLSDLLECGAADAALIHRAPECFTRGSDRVKRVFPDYPRVELEYYQRTGMHPIMHCVVLRREVYRAYPWALRSIYEALCKSRDHARCALRETGALSSMVPFLPAVMDETLRVFGERYWPYGMAENRDCLERLVRYAHQQGLTPRALDVSELFEEIRSG